ncbi:MAG: D-2-hydroxyacid dehydrogenase [Hyphomicrobiales bacterium]|nr:D-2-hydroxyacid dehydrogenase [Hyphomicrobiales bacterium]
MHVLVLDNFADVYARHLEAEFPQLTLHRATKIAEIAAPLDEVDVLVAFGIAINDELLSGMSRLKWVQSLATGTDHFTNCPSFRSQTLLTSARGIHGAPMRETVTLLMLMLARKMQVIMRNQFARKWERVGPWTLLEGKTAVLVGVGVSTSAIAHLLKAYGMRVIGVSGSPREEPGFDAVRARSELVDCAREADFLVNVLPGGPRNEKAIGADVLNAMPERGFFINVGRGETVDEEALLDVLRRRRIAGAGLDVFASAPLQADNAFWDLDNVVVSPHIAGFFSEYEDYVMPILMDNMRAFLGGDVASMTNVVDH